MYVRPFVVMMERFLVSINILKCCFGFSQITLGKETFHIYKLCGEGAYAKAYRAVTMDPLNVTLISYDLEDDDKQQVSILHQLFTYETKKFFLLHSKYLVSHTQISLFIGKIMFLY